MKSIIIFLFTYVFVFFIYQVFIVKSAIKSKKSRKKKDKEPFEYYYLKHRYSIDEKKISYPKILKVISLVSSFDIALIVTVVSNIENTMIQILVGFILAIVLIIVSYHLVYLYYKKKGMICNE